MDLLTQGLTGALLATSAASRERLRAAAVVGFGAGMLADVDVLIRSSTDPLLFLEFHRHFTHALLFIPAGALIAALLFWPFLRQRLGFGRLYLFALLGYAPSGLLDACTSYGTYLWWPFSDARVAWSVISIVDPVFTLGLLIALAVAWRARAARRARYGLLFAAVYLGVGSVQHQRAADAAARLAESRGHAVERALVKPTLGNLLLWRSVYESGGRFHVDAVRVGLAAAPRVFPGGVLDRLHPLDTLASAPAGTRLHDDLRRFDRFSDGHLVRSPRDPAVIGDVRYALLPNALEPLWGILLPDDPSRHAAYVTSRKVTPAIRQAFAAMLFPRE